MMAWLLFRWHFKQMLCTKIPKQPESKETYFQAAFFDSVNKSDFYLNLFKNANDLC